MLTVKVFDRGIGCYYNSPHTGLLSEAIHYVEATVNKAYWGHMELHRIECGLNIKTTIEIFELEVREVKQLTIKPQ